MKGLERPLLTFIIQPTNTQSSWEDVGNISKQMFGSSRGMHGTREVINGSQSLNHLMDSISHAGL